MMITKKKILLIFICVLVLVPLIFFGVVFYTVTQEAATRIQRGIIRQIIFSESPVYYDDGKTPIGVFFEKTHRKYLSYDQIPKIFVKAMVAAEDKNFFHHHGVDFRAIVRAMLVNLKAGKVVQGGSTITQQTAKNIFKRQKRSFKAKLRELIQAFLLERKYTKQEILEMYINQFFVTGFGKGLGIAAEYFFNKEAKDLTLVEAAFIAGAVQAPNRYNPFIKRTEVERQRARQLAKQRKNYVLKNMLKLHFITREQYEEAAKQDVPFKKGKITYKLNVILDYVRDQLSSEYFRTILGEQGVSNIATSGIKIYTSINKDIQEKALESLRTHLPYMDVLLNGYRHANVQEIYDESPKSTLPFPARITHIDNQNSSAHLVVSWQNGGGAIDFGGLKPMGEAWLKWKMGAWAKFDRSRVASFLKNFKIGDTVAVQYEYRGNGKKLKLTVFPQLNGAVIVLRDGMIKAMVGGYYNHFFNRAVDAKRQLGSIFKPIVFTAALQLKWNTLDGLRNRKGLFQFENTYYIPRPDHPPKSPEVSLAWAGVKSENLATVWLLYHLTDHLNLGQFKELAQIVGLSRKKDESYEHFVRRIRDKNGVIVNRDSLMEAAFEASKKEIEADLIFEGFEDTLQTLRELPFDIDRKKLRLLRGDKKGILLLSFKRLRGHSIRMISILSKIAPVLEEFEVTHDPVLRAKLSGLFRHFFRDISIGDSQRIVFMDQNSAPGDEYLIPLTPQWILSHGGKIDAASVWIDNILPFKVIRMLDQTIKKNYTELNSRKRYDMEVLWQIRDFRTLVNLSYVVYLSKKMGIYTKLDKVLSFPLGPNSISILEAALVYETIMTGKSFHLDNSVGPEYVPIITKIEDRNGETLWQYLPTPQEILTKRTTAMVTDILRNVMVHGTGRRAKDAVKLNLEGPDMALKLPVPTFGKTGTANRFTNSSFVGFVPAPSSQDQTLSTARGFVIASYVGYDDNRPMKSKHTAIYGSSGALPLWIDTANGIVNSQLYRKSIQVADLAFETYTQGLEPPGEFAKVPVDPVNGLPLVLPPQEVFSSDMPYVLSDAELRGKTWFLNRTFEPLEGAIQ